MPELKKSINDVYYQYHIHLTPLQIKSFKVLCKTLKYNNLGHTFKLNYSKPKNKKIFVVFQTKSQIKDVNKAKKNKEKYNLKISNIQIKETCSSVIKLINKKVIPKITDDRNNYRKYTIYLTPSQIKSFLKSYIIPLNYKNLKYKKGVTVFLTNTQINKLEKAMVNGEKFELKFSEKQFKINYDFIMRENRKNLANLKLGNQKKIDKIKALKLKLF